MAPIVAREEIAVSYVSAWRHALWGLGCGARDAVAVKSRAIVYVPDPRIAHRLTDSKEDTRGVEAGLVVDERAGDSDGTKGDDAMGG